MEAVAIDGNCSQVGGLLDAVAGRTLMFGDLVGMKEEVPGQNMQRRCYYRSNSHS